MKKHPRYQRSRVLDVAIVSFVMGTLCALGFSLLQSRRVIDQPIAEFACPALSDPRMSLLRSLANATPWCAAPTPVAAIAPRSGLVAASADLWEPATNTQKLQYNVTTLPPFASETATPRGPSLDDIVAGAIARLQEQQLPVDAVSISLVDLTGDCCAYSGFRDRESRYPASIVKLFWLVALYGYFQAQEPQPDADVYVDDAELMAHYSNNGASSRVLDALTQTTSGEDLAPAELATWMAARQRVNEYFTLAGYGDVNIAHKTFPIPDLGWEERVGRDRQFAAGEGLTTGPTDLSRNHLTTYDTARLLYEIDRGLAVSAADSDRIKAHLRHSTDPGVWQMEEPNAIAGFFGEYLPPDVELYTKLGFTFDDGRQEAALIASPDGKTRFVLVMFANDAAFSHGEVTIFSTVARDVYDQMQQRQASTTSVGNPRGDR